jgi:glucoamylase
MRQFTGLMRQFTGLCGRSARLAVALAMGASLGLVPAGPLSQAAQGQALPTLEQAFDNVGVTSPAAPAAGNFDGIGDSFNSAGLAEDALSPGGSLLHDGLAFTWPDVAPGQPDNVVADGQTVALSGQGTVLGVVGASAYGSASGTFTVTYADGSTTSAQVTLADWVDNTPAQGTDFLATTAGWDPGGTIPVSLSYASVALDPNKQVVSVTLPTVGASVGRGVTSMHIFDLAIGSPGAEAVGAPGAPSYYDLARKDCVGTAADTASKVWFTVADGALSDTYAPTIDNTDVKSLYPIVTAPGLPAQLEPRDMTYSVSELGSTGMACRVVALDGPGHFAVVTDFVTDPFAEAVVMQVSLVPLPGAPAGLSLYLRFHPLLNGHGGGGSGNAGGESATVVSTSRGDIPLSYSTNSFTEATNRTYASPIYAALAASRPFGAVETGFAGTPSDGLSELDASGSLTTSAPDADNGNVVQTVELSWPSSHGLASPQALPTAPSPQMSPPGPVPPPPVPPNALGAYANAPGFAAVAGNCGPGPAPGTQGPPGPGAAAVTPAAIAASVAATAHLTAPLPTTSVESQTVALGFGPDEQSALSAALGASAVPFPATFAAYQSQWARYDAQLCPPLAPGQASKLGLSPPQLGEVADAYWLSANVIKASEDKTFLGATVASLASPWGQAVPAGQPSSNDNLAPYFGSYREVFPRDAYETFTGFLADGDLGTARQMVYYWFDNLQLPNGSFPRNSLLNGKAAPDTFGLQLDETADPLIAAWQAGLAGDASLYEQHIKPAADFLAANGPETPSSVERWEEQNGYSPSTIADEVAGLVAAANIANVQGDLASGRLWLATADNFLRIALATTVTTDGPLSSGPYFIRVDKTGNPDESYYYTLGNGNNTPVDQRTVIDQGFLELTRLGELPASDPVVANSLAVASGAIDVSTPSGTGVLRYNGDGYGDCQAGTVHDPVNHTVSTCSTTGAPWAATDTGTGHVWPVLSGENAEYQLLAGNTSAAVADLQFMLNSASGIGLVPEQVWDFPDVPASPYGSGPATASIGLRDGLPDGSAAPLTWAQAQLLRLIRDIGAGQLLDQPAVVAQRYLPSIPPAAPLQVTAPVSLPGGNVPPDMQRPSVIVSASSPDVTVSGAANNETVGLTVTATTLPGATVDIAVTGTPLGSAVPSTTLTTVTAGANGSASGLVALQPGTNSIEVAVSSAGATNEALFQVNDVIVPGTVVLNAAGPADGGYGPGTYAYPTYAPNGVPAFPPDSFKLTGLTVIDSGPTVTFQVGIANMVSTFGSPDGADLLDLYIHSPSTSQIESTAAANPWNYSIAPADAWNQLIEVDGFGTDEWVTPSSPTAGLSASGSLGTPQVEVASSSAPAGNGETPGVISVTVPAATLGAPASGGSWSGWTFTVTLTGQDGFGFYDARTFTSTPTAFTFGVCSQALASEPSPPAICSYNPSLVPYVLDTIPPAGVDVQAELNPTLGPVVLQGVTVP